MFGKEREEQLIAFCQKMIQAKSYSGEEEQVVVEMKKFCEETGFTDIHVDKYGNCICHIKGKRQGPKLLFDGHMDTVPVPDPSGWEHDPFGAEIVDGKMYGRGTSDMKGALSSMLAAAIFFAKDCDFDFPGDIYVAGVVHEECFEGVAAREISAYVKPDYVIIGEASQLNIKIGQRGRGELQVETFGVPAHSASPHEGVNAVYKMCKVIEAIQELKPTNHSVLGDGILELVDIKSSPFPGASVVPDYCRATYDRRLLVGETKENVLAPIQELLERMMKEDQSLKAKVSFVTMEEHCYTGNIIGSERFFPGWLYEEKDSFVQAVYQEMKSMGFDPTITNYDFCTNGSHYAGEAGIKTLGIGPSKETLAHKINEYIEIDQLLKATQCYYGTMKALLK
ncbi:YgeY family selenium metabolism-linked hydrolase [Lachnospiraceae bacterium LCP25S3_G4]